MSVPSPFDTSLHSDAAPSLPPVPFDPELEPVLEVFAEAGMAERTRENLTDWRAQSEAMIPTDDVLRRGGAFEVHTRVVPGASDGPDVSLLVCRPTGVRGPRPVFYYSHPGGMILGNCRMGVMELLDHAVDLAFIVVSVEYRLAPEHPHPAPIEDCYAGLTWVGEHADEIGGDPERVLVGGASAGGGLSAALALLARDHGGPRLAGQMLMCPMLDDRNNTPSAHQMSGLGMWDRSANSVGWGALLGGRAGGSDVSPYAAPARAEDLSNLPPAFVDVASAETFRDEAVDYARRLWQAGGRAELHVWPGGFHSSESVAPNAALSRDTVLARRRWLRRIL